MKTKTMKNRYNNEFLHKYRLVRNIYVTSNILGKKTPPLYPPIMSFVIHMQTYIRIIICGLGLANAFNRMLGTLGHQKQK